VYLAVFNLQKPPKTILGVRNMTLVTRKLSLAATGLDWTGLGRSLRQLPLRLALTAGLALSLLSVCRAQQNLGYYRFPTIYADTIVFTSEGDLWEVGTDGGVARRLTTHLAEESNAAFSPDGKTIAFSASYEGPTEVYTIDATGGLPVRRTFDGDYASVVGWTPDGKILYATRRYSTLPNAQLATIDRDNRIQIIPLSQAAHGCYDSSGGTLFFTRLPAQGSSTKRYKGGTAQTLWKFDGTHEAVALTADYAGASKNAMWWNGRVYFLTDRDGTMNLWSMDESGKHLQQLTHHQGLDIQHPSLSRGRIVYQLGADLHLYDTSTATDKTVPIELASDFDHLREHWVKNPLDYTSSIHLSPNGDRVILTSRGRVFVAPVKHGRLVDAVGHTPGRYRQARFMADGKSLLVLSTASGEVEFWKLPANGAGLGEQLTTDGKILRWEGMPSPDGKWIAHQDKGNQLWLLETNTKTQKRIALDENGGNGGPAFDTVRWSPDSKWFTYAQTTDNQFSRILLYSVDTGVATPLTTNRYDNGSACWSPDGKWIYFLSDRSLKSVVRSPWGSRQPDPYFDRAVKMYQLPLKKGLISPFEPPDELHPEKTETSVPAPHSAKPDVAAKPPDAKTDPGAKPPDSAKTVAAPPPTVEIDLDGIIARIQEVPAPPGNYSDLAIAGKRLLWIDRDPDSPDQNKLVGLTIDSKDEKPETLFEGLSDFEVSADGKKILVRKHNDLFVFDSSLPAAALKDPKTMEEAHVDLKDWTFSVIPRDELHEAFQDAWRLHRDYFYDPHMHGVDWKAMREKYAGLVDRVHDREELSDVLAQMVSELSILHTFVFGGDMREGADHIPVASLGARLARDSAAGGYIVEHIYQCDPDRPDKLGPLLRPGIDIHEGDVILAINGRELSSVDPGDLLRNQARKQVLLRVRPKDKIEARDVLVKPISEEDDSDLRYREWEYSRREIVEQASAGHIGYVHLRAMGAADINQWAEEYTPVFNRDGLIIDVRHNGGGNIDSWILGKLIRKAWMYWQPRVGKPYWNMQQSFRGHIVVLCDEWTGSDGEAFAEGFRRLGLGKVIGTRTWGGEVWLSAGNNLADGGIATTGETGVFGPERSWLIEGHGVDPDIVVDDLPHATFEGKDAQLDAAIKHLEQLIHDKPNPVPAPPDYPDKSFRPLANGHGTTGTSGRQSQ
jgi:tricorn protease